MQQQQQPIPQPQSHGHSQQVEEDDDYCLMARNLDSGEFLHVGQEEGLDLPLQELSSSRKGSTWDKYWEERQTTKNSLIRAVNSNNEQQLIQLLAHKQLDINEYTYMDGWSLLHQSTTKKLYSISLILLNHGCNIHLQTQSMKRTCLHFAVLEQCQQLVDMYLAWNANPNVVDIDRCTPLHYAVQFGYRAIVEMLLSKCQLDFRIRNMRGHRVVDCCRDQRIREMLHNYIKVHDLHVEFTDAQTVTFHNGHTYFTRSRSDFIERILSDSNKFEDIEREHVDNSELDILKIVKKETAFSKLGSKISKQKYERITQFAKKSIENFKELQQEGTIESMENYDMIRQLGSGSFGTVFLIRKKKSSKLFALKRLSKALIAENKMKKYAYAQREILKNIRHPFILHGYSFFQDPLYLYMVIDFCAGGDLEKSVRRCKFDEEKAKKYCCEVVLAIEELHRKNYIFRDLKVSNVLLDENGHAKLADFGLAKQTELSHSFLGSVAYLAPEMLVETANKPHTAVIDWYLLGVFVFEMIVGVPPFFNENRMLMFESIKKEKPRLPPTLTPECKDFLLRTLAKKPQQRLGSGGAREIKEHNWFRNIDWAHVLDKKLEMEVPQINQKQLRSREYIEQQSMDNSQINNFRGWDYFEGDRS